MRVKLVLDETAVLAYSKGSIHVGEPVAQLAEETDARFAVPVTCLADAGTRTDSRAMLVVLAGLEQAMVTPVEAGRWSELLTLSQLLGSVDHAVPFLTATKFDAYLLTAAPGRYPEVDRIIDISDS
jgi:hypothetical protein